MAELDDVSRERALTLIRAIRGTELSEGRASRAIRELERLLVCPHVSDLMFHQWPDLSDEEVVEHALRYTPIALPGTAA